MAPVPLLSRIMFAAIMEIGDRREIARVAELADALDLGSSEETHGGSSPPSRTMGGEGARRVQEGTGEK